jgi:hypothetical protein
LEAAPCQAMHWSSLNQIGCLATDVFPCEDGHAQERSLLPQVLPTVQTRDLWIAGRNFCTTGFLFGIASRDGAFLIRQHAQTLVYELLGTRRKLGRCPTGVLYEQKMRLTDAEGKSLEVRRITIELKKPTRDGATEIHLLTNLPARTANARAIADLYLRRWTVEEAFHELDQAKSTNSNSILASAMKTSTSILAHSENCGSRRRKG